MTKSASNKSVGKSSVVAKVLLSFGMPVIFLLAFFCQQIFSVDNIGWVNGFSHPLMGWDHLVTMLAVGIWAAQLRGQAIWMLPLAFVGVMSLGGIAGAAGVALPSVEGIILLSCAVFSVLITRKVRFSAKINVMIVAFFAFFHGFAHGQEISASASLISYTLGFMLATLLLHGAGILVAKLVILTVTGLMSVIFSTAAIAEVSESSLDSSPFFSVDADNRIYTPGFFEPQKILDRDLYSQYCSQPLSVSRNAADGETSRGRQKFKELSGEVSYHRCAQPSHAYLQASKKLFDPGFIHFELKPAQVFGGYCALSLQFGWPFLLFILGFSSLYPSINNTPGILLSNGVGLNSPPASKLAVTSRLFNYFCSTPGFFVEDIRLQSVFVRLVNGIPRISPRHFFISRVRVATGQLPSRFLNFQSGPRSREQEFLCLKSACLSWENALRSSCFTLNLPLSGHYQRSIRGNQDNLSPINKTTFNL